MLSQIRDATKQHWTPVETFCRRVIHMRQLKFFSTIAGGPRTNILLSMKTEKLIRPICSWQ